MNRSADIGVGDGLGAGVGEALGEEIGDAFGEAFGAAHSKQKGLSKLSSDNVGSSVARQLVLENICWHLLSSFMKAPFSDIIRSPHWDLD